MRLNEFTTAQQQMDLLRQIMDCTWSAIATQHKTQAAQKAATKYKPKVKVAATVGARVGQKAVAQQLQQPVQKQQVQQTAFQRQQISASNPNSIKPIRTSAVATNAVPKIAPAA
jgi:ribosomal protein L18